MICLKQISYDVQILFPTNDWLLIKRINKIHYVSQSYFSFFFIQWHTNNNNIAHLTGVLCCSDPVYLKSLNEIDSNNINDL